MMHIHTSRCGNDIDCPVCEHGYNEFGDRLCPTCDMTPSERNVMEMEIVKNWYYKRWISLNEYLRLTGLIF